MDTITGAIFDMDGTILDSGAMWDQAAPAVVRQLGYIPKASLQEDALQLGMDEFAPFLKEDYAMAQPVEEIQAAVEDVARQYYFHRAALKPGAFAFLQALKEAGIPMALATATNRVYVEAALKTVGVFPLFDTILTCPEVGQGKHSPRIFRQALADLGSEKASTWVFEDALHAIRTARADGFPVCAVDDEGAAFQRQEIWKTATCHIPGFPAWQSLPFAHRLAVPAATC